MDEVAEDDPGSEGACAWRHTTLLTSKLPNANVTTQFIKGFSIVDMFYTAI
jgi:hypothetical protein